MRKISSALLLAGIIAAPLASLSAHPSVAATASPVAHKVVPKTLEIGSAAAIDAKQAPTSDTTGASTIQLASDASRRFSVPTGFSVLTRLRHHASQTGSIVFHVYRSIGEGEYTTIARVAAQTTAGETLVIPTRIEVEPGDLLGLVTTNVPQAYETGDADDVVGFAAVEAADPAVGETYAVGTTNPGYVLAVAASVETDADGDGFGDVTQDGCPTKAGKKACGTKIVKDPGATVATSGKSAFVAFKFASKPAGLTTFECSIDGKKFKKCQARLAAGFGLGRHELKVRAANAGKVDKTPAVFGFRVVRS